MSRNIQTEESRDHITAFKHFVCKQEPCLITELSAEGDLGRWRTKARISFEEAKHVLHQCLLTLEYLHSRSITHRDIKPANILLHSRRPFFVKLTDFGLAKDSSALDTTCGTSLYAAPKT